MSDARFARKFGRAISRVKRRRIKLGIRVFNSPRHDWTAADDKLLGERTDEDVAALLRTTVKAVQKRRSQFKIAPCAKQQRERRHAFAKSGQRRRAGGRFGKYLPEEDKLMGTMPDQELAMRLGRSHKAVEGRRIHLGIPKIDPRLHQWTPEEDALLGVETDGTVASRLGLTLSAVAHRRRRLGRAVRFAHGRRWTPQEDAQLGTASDTDIAARIGRKIGIVCVRRQKLGIPNFYWQQRCGRQRKLKSA
jgi:hypothetical protein